MALAEDEKLASALADVGIGFAVKGNVEKAKDSFYKALVYDESCPIALYELGKIFEGEGDTSSAANFYVKAAQGFNVSPLPAFKTKAADCAFRIQKLNRFASQFTVLMESYAQDLGKIAAKYSDDATQTEIQNKMAAINLTSLISQEKIPDIIKPGKTKKIIQNTSLNESGSYKATATASSLETKDFPAKFAVDGDDNTRWSSKLADPQWLKLDFNKIVTISKFVLKWEVAAGKEYSIKTSNDGITWQEVYVQKDGKGETETISLKEPAQCRYVKLDLIKRLTHNGYSLWEVEAYEKK